MQAILLVVHLLIALIMIGLILLQRSEGGALGIGGGGGGGGGFMTGRGTANFLTRATAVLAGLFFLTSMGLTLVGSKRTGPIVPPTPVTSGGPAKPGPAKPAGPSAPVK
ncbi:MAG: preprotein translocase subunit SecG [Alphaproteobacteria bacterium]